MYFEIIQTFNRRPNNTHKTSLQSYKTQIKILAYPGLAKLVFEQPGPAALLSGLAYSIYYLSMWASCSSCLEIYISALFYTFDITDQIKVAVITRTSTVFGTEQLFFVFSFKF